MSIRAQIGSRGSMRGGNEPDRAGQRLVLLCAVLIGLGIAFGVLSIGPAVGHSSVNVIGPLGTNMRLKTPEGGMDVSLELTAIIRRPALFFQYAEERTTYVVVANSSRPLRDRDTEALNESINHMIANQILDHPALALVPIPRLTTAASADTVTARIEEALPAGLLLNGLVLLLIAAAGACAAYLCIYGVRRRLQRRRRRI